MVGCEVEEVAGVVEGPELVCGSVGWVGGGVGVWRWWWVVKGKGAEVLRDCGVVCGVGDVWGGVDV